MLGWTSYAEVERRVSPVAAPETRVPLISNGNLMVTSGEKSLNVEN